MWFDHDKSDEIRRPRYLKVLTTSRTVPLTIIGFVGDHVDLLWETCMTALSGLKGMKMEVAHAGFNIVDITVKVTESFSDDRPVLKKICWYDFSTFRYVGIINVYKEQQRAKD